MDLFDDGPADNTPEFSVSELSGAVKKAIEGGFSHVRVRGEVGRVSRPGSGHIYLDLKDDRSVLSGVIWKGRAQGLAHRPEEGMEVVATGKLTTFPGQSKYQMIIEDIAPAGAGALMAMLEKRKAALAAEGLFAPERKQTLPYLPGIIGVITSPSGAVIRDILHRLRDRFPRKVLVWPVAVQGQRCAPDVAAAIAGFNQLTPGGALPRPELLIVARGGGSLEDLWGFNEEIVARAAAASDIPLISAVGHETDTTLIDFVSDMRAPTPTAAAELAVPVRIELLAWADQQAARLNRALTTGVSQRQQRVRDLGRALPRKDSLLNVPTQRLDHLGDRLPAALKTAASKKRLQLSEASLRPAILSRRIAEDRRRLSTLCARLTPVLLEDRITRQSERLAITMTRLSDRATRQQTERTARLATLVRMHETLGYKATLARGYAVVHGTDGLVTRAADAKGPLDIEFTDGRVSTIAK
ncbi:exodeoxyribonuclease VII large subunit [Yoonia sp. I 8.24]|uniref:exodeoxyribonuclease VII large subunit n=1 Tax=Yoonia sp. I 8.24 TaxID=1537229 RepID=UPI001EE0156A|nr:exodeoxyribonuclease VII large subunit [Yoonia sp. I 8.24]MCG3267311.1 exodeoxyribonuclease VII large subunit [Yoonia sp. I 8.24]